MTCVFKQQTVFLSLSRHVRTCKVSFSLWSSAQCWKFSENSSLDMETCCNHVTVGVLSSFPDVSNISWNVVLTILAMIVYHTWKLAERSWIRVGSWTSPQKMWTSENSDDFKLSQFEAIVFLSPGSQWCSLDFSLRLIELVILINADWCLGFYDLITACDLPDTRETTGFRLNKLSLSLFPKV